MLYLRHKPQKGAYMNMGKAATKAKNKYNTANYDRIYLVVAAGKKEEYKAAADARGVSLNQFITECIENEIKAH